MLVDVKKRFKMYEVTEALSNKALKTSDRVLAVKPHLKIFYISKRRIKNILEIVDSFLIKAPYMTVPGSTKLTSHIISISSVIGHLTSLKTR